MSVFIDDFEIDAAISEEPALQSQITNHPVERGGDIADHIIKRPLTFVMTGIVSDTPIGLVAESRGEGTLPSSDALAFLRRIHDEKRIVQISGVRGGPYTSMTMQSLRAPRTAATGGSLQFSARFQQVEFVDVATEDKITLVAVPRARKKVKRGSKPAEKKDPEDVKDSPAVRTSWAKDIVSEVKGIF